MSKSTVPWHKWSFAMSGFLGKFLVHLESGVYAMQLYTGVIAC